MMIEIGDGKTCHARPSMEERRDIVLPVEFVSRFRVILDNKIMRSGWYSGMRRQMQQMEKDRDDANDTKMAKAPIGEEKNGK